VFLVRHELDFYIPEDDSLHGHSRENLKSYINNRIQFISMFCKVQF
jgi:hypothetical protein